MEPVITEVPGFFNIWLAFYSPKMIVPGIKIKTAAFRFNLHSPLEQEIMRGYDECQSRPEGRILILAFNRKTGKLESIR
jgi:hypothetical protein